MILPVFALLFAATLDLGRLFYSQITLTNAAREGAFQAAQTPFSYIRGAPCKADDKPEFEDDGENLVVCRVMLESRNSFLVVKSNDIDRTCNMAGCPKAVGSSTTVTVQGEFTFVTPLLSPFFGGGQNITLTASATAQREYLPTPPPSMPFATTRPTVLPSECVITVGEFEGEPGVFPPNVIGKNPATAEDLIRLKGLVAAPEGDLKSGSRNIVREQNPDETICVQSGSTVSFKFRP